MKKKQAEAVSTVREYEHENTEARYKYSLFRINSNRVASYGLPLYSIRIEMWTHDGRHTEAETGEIFADLGKATVFFERLCKNLATPLNLAYILEDSIMI
ncbi:MAG: hypothetical protein IKC87_07245 [Clostridia bacterium]|nr:hypothetical protein [Clostridia bacterium]